MQLAKPHPASRGTIFKIALVTVPVILLLGRASGMLADFGEDESWFASLEKPALFPPPIAFPIVWSALYVLMGLALAMVLAAARPSARWPVLTIFVVQLALNLTWAPLFFAGEQIGWAMALIVALDLAIIVTIMLFARIDRRAAWLLAPYLAWVAFATGLN